MHTSLLIALVASAGYLLLQHQADGTPMENGKRPAVMSVHNMLNHKAANATTTRDIPKRRGIAKYFNAHPHRRTTKFCRHKKHYDIEMRFYEYIERLQDESRMKLALNKLLPKREAHTRPSNAKGSVHCILFSLHEKHMRYMSYLKDIPLKKIYRLPNIMAQIMTGVALLNELGVAHGNIQQSSVWMTYGTATEAPTIKLLDFGKSILKKDFATLGSVARSTKRFNKSFANFEEARRYDAEEMAALIKKCIDIYKTEARPFANRAIADQFNALSKVEGMLRDPEKYPTMLSVVRTEEYNKIASAVELS
ncbi:hypothetical protein SYNPS1DRAFT_30252 [Syncephalis pseudoplumigaleata]|uniref:Protein kinase domain-containing protein n=1 Tax=Syncephalis pseudoplumigaleata TaxID=1712513 RepID=A0A4P9YVC3_9FUNG|nr:hypothetical protein SYNPS1DRAFT_30252 [Syncephalis pseudoplumigaleata]|eukprot:RKP23976.1 hypothetical protein SYNPS1DRAFT_30252 [Syncephalis pseudoplumigaleata]